MACEYLIRLPSGQVHEVGAPRPADESNGEPLYLVSNVFDAPCEVYAPEIDWYLRNSGENERNCLENVVKICDLRTTMFENGRDLELSFSVGSRVAVISEQDEPELAAQLEQRGFQVVDGLHADEIAAVNGSIGGFSIFRTGKNAGDAVPADQIVWVNGPEKLQQKRGIYDPGKTQVTGILETLVDNLGVLHAVKAIRYDRSSCLYDGKRHEICSRCVDVCPTLAIAKPAGEKKLAFSEIDCIGCGRCVAVCPTGAVEYTSVPYADSFERAIEHYRGKVALVLPERVDLNSLRIPQRPDVLPLLLPSVEFLHEGYLFDLPRVTGMPIVIYSNDFSELQQAVFTLVNEVFIRIFREQAIYACQSVAELETTLQNLPDQAVFVGDLPLKNGNKKRNIAAHLKQMVAKEDYGIIKTSPLLSYGLVAIKAQSCTLCLACSEACPTDALWPNSEDNSLRYNPSLCTSCGYCQLTCPEQDCLTLVPNVLALAPVAFTDTIMAKDTIFRCVECGAGVGPVKAIEKIANKMKPHFAGDENRLKALYCCPDCKAKTMLASLES